MALVQCASECQEQLERDGARVKIMTDHLVNVQQAKCQRWMRMWLFLELDAKGIRWCSTIMTLQNFAFLTCSHAIKFTPWEFAVQELVNTQQLVDAKKNETTTEEHLQVQNMHHFPQIIAISWLAWFILCVFNYFHILVMRPLPIGSMAAREIYQLGKLSFTFSWALTRKHSAKHRRPDNLGEQIFLNPPEKPGVFFCPRQLGRLKSEIVRLQKVLEDTQDYLGLPQYNQKRPQVLKTLTAKKSLVLELLRLKKIQLFQEQNDFNQCTK